VVSVPASRQSTTAFSDAFAGFDYVAPILTATSPKASPSHFADPAFGPAALSAQVPHPPTHRLFAHPLA
jgi:hypothetical protein